MFKGTTNALAADALNLFAFAEVGFGTTAASGINHEQLVGVPNLNANIQGYIGVVTGISTCPGIGTYHALKCADDGMIGQFEHTVIVTDGGPEVLTVL